MATEQRVCRCWCGSTDFKKDKDGATTCLYCGSKFVSEDGFAKFKILPMMDGRQFVRSAWIQLARDDAPLEIFDCDFKDIGEIDYLAMIDTVEARVPYQASVGYDREAAPNDKAHNEKAPHADTISSSDFDAKRRENRPVKDYKDEERRHKAAKRKTVTDWRPFNSEYNAKSTVCVKNGDKAVSSTIFDLSGDSVEPEYGLDSFNESIDASSVRFDGDAFLKSLDGIEPGSIVAPGKNECEHMMVNPSARREAKKRHDEDIETSLVATIPGDRHKDLNFAMEGSVDSTQLFVVPEYYATISYKNRNYTVKALPFGEVSTTSVEIENKEGLRAYRDEKAEELKAEEKKIEENRSKEKWNRGKAFSIFTIALLIVSIVGLVAVGVSTVVLFATGQYYSRALFAFMIVFATLFVAAAALFIASRAHGRKSEDEIRKKVKDELESKRNDLNAEIDKFAESYRSKQLELLNKKLNSLCLEPASIKDICEQGE